MKNYSNWTAETDRMVIFTEKAPEALRGKKLPINALPADRWPNLEIRFNAKVNLDTLDVLSDDDIEYNDSNWPTLNELISNGMIEDWFPYRRADMCNIDSMFDSNGEPPIRKIQKFFKERGFTVTKEAIMHNFHAWERDMKSGFCDEKNNVHVFSPCGCNPFNLHVSELHPGCDDWQITYEW